MIRATDVATWVSILVVVVGGGIWVGSTASETKSNAQTVTEQKVQTDKLRAEVPPAIARLDAKVEALQDDIEEVKRTQQQILEELRKKK